MEAHLSILLAASSLVPAAWLWLQGCQAPGGGCEDEPDRDSGCDSGCDSGDRPSPDRSYERQRMVEEQIIRRGVRDKRVLDAMRRIPRERFVPASLARYAYGDHPLAIGHEQTISQPYIVAYMSERLQLRGRERVLEIGTGSGYQAAVLAELAGEVYTIEIVDHLAREARARLDQPGYEHVHVRSGDGHAGWPEQAPFDRILLTAAPERVPTALLDQLAVGGWLVAPVGPGEGQGSTQELVLIRRTPEGFTRDELLPVRFVPMTGGTAPAGPDPAPGGAAATAEASGPAVE